MKENNNPEQEKSQWNRPVLTVLVRNNPEEEVLTACKLVRGSVGPGSGYDVCAVPPDPVCEGKCNNLTTS